MDFYYFATNKIARQSINVALYYRAAVDSATQSAEYLA